MRDVPRTSPSASSASERQFDVSVLPDLDALMRAEAEHIVTPERSFLVAGASKAAREGQCG
jgi:hypothetical protein